MEEPDNNSDKQQVLWDLARIFRQHIVTAPNADGGAHFCLNCGQHIPNDYCAFCHTNGYSIPVLTAEQIVALEEFPNQLHRGAQTSDFAEGNP
jgi:hypothetical protein